MIEPFRGKNWVPLVYRSQLYVVHRVAPQLRWFVYDAINGCATADLPTETRSIGQWRGGSGFVPYDGPTTMISVEYRTMDSNTHVPYVVLHVDMLTNRTNTIALNTARHWRGILDPTSLWKRRKVVDGDCSHFWYVETTLL